MKKVLVGILAATLVIGASSTSVMAAGRGRTGGAGRFFKANISRYVDADGDGVCDNAGQGQGTGTRPQDGPGMQRGHRGGRR